MTDAQAVALLAAVLFDRRIGDQNYTEARRRAICEAIDLYADAKAMIVTTTLESPG